MTLTPAETEALILSGKVAAAAVTVMLPFAICVAWALARLEFTGKALVEAAVAMPLVMPPVVTGYLLLVVLGRRGPVGALLHDALGVTFAFDWTGAVIASAVVAFPLAVRAIRLSIEAVDPKLEVAARTLGAGPARRFLTVTLPLSTPGVITGSVLAFARSLGEFGATITFVGSIPGETRTLPLAIYTAIQQPGGDVAAARLVVISAAVAALAVGISEAIARRSRR